MTSETQPRKTDIQKLQRAIVDGLEDVKGQDIVVFNTEHLSPLFERVIIASGTSNRQTKALASSISDAVREAGFPKPRVEGEENGEWIIVDCGAAVAHVMQPTIRAYYHLEEIWGGKTVRLASAVTKTVAGVAKPKAPARKKAVPEGADGVEVPAQKASSARKGAAKPAAKTVAAPETAAVKKAPAKKAAVKAASATTLEKKPAAKKPVAAVAAKVKTLVVGKPAAKKATPAARKSPSRKTAG